MMKRSIKLKRMRSTSPAESEISSSIVHPIEKRVWNANKGSSKDKNAR
jgi:hypothetical protein